MIKLTEISHDFSDLTSSTTTGKPVRLTMRYAAPEALTGPRNRSTDIWELGCVLIEMISWLRGHKLPEILEFFHKRHAIFEDQDTTASWCDELRSGVHSQHELGRKDIALLSFVQDCMLQYESQLRPSIGQVCKKLEDMDFVYSPRSLGESSFWSGSCCNDGLLFMRKYLDPVPTDNIRQISPLRQGEDETTVPEWPVPDLKHRDSRLAFVVLDLDFDVVIIRKTAIASPTLTYLENLDQLFVACDLAAVRRHLNATKKDLSLDSAKSSNLFLEDTTPTEILQSFDAGALKDTAFLVGHFNVYIRNMKNFPKLCTVQFSFCKFNLRVERLKDVPYVMMIFDREEGETRGWNSREQIRGSWTDGHPLPTPYRYREIVGEVCTKLSHHRGDHLIY